MIWIWPQAKIADPICTYLFSILVIYTTIPVFKDCIKVLMESEPNGVDSSKIRQEIIDIKEVQTVEDFHVWALAGNKNFLTVHVTLSSADIEKYGAGLNKEVYNKIHAVLLKHDICHFTA
jgi:cation diffusion facilitator family transporter